MTWRARLCHPTPDDRANSIGGPGELEEAGGLESRDAALAWAQEREAAHHRGPSLLERDEVFTKVGDRWQQYGTGYHWLLVEEED